MAKAEIKTKKAEASVDDFLDAVEDEIVRDDCRKIIELMLKASGAKPKMWGASIVGFGDFHYKYESGREGDTFLTGFSPRKHKITLYLTSSEPINETLLAKLGNHKIGKGCLYIKSLKDVDENVLSELIEDSIGKKQGK